jgi:hypothetical protein
LEDLQVIYRAATLWMWLSILLPFFLGWRLTGTATGALVALLWASGGRILLLHRVTWAVNSLGHRSLDVGGLEALGALAGLVSGLPRGCGSRFR